MNIIPTPEQFEKYASLLRELRAMNGAAVAFSAGVDSTLLLHAAREALGDRMIAVTAALRSFPERELAEAKAFCEALGVRHFVIVADELEIEGFAQNPKDRCYLCKRALFGKIVALAAEQGFSAVVEGSNVDDDGDYRPGKRAIAELGIRSPLRDCGLTKADIRALSRHFGLPTWDKPAYACLSSRIPYGEAITREKLQMVDRAEQLLLDLGFRQMRVRVHGSLARVELEPNQFDRFMAPEIRERVAAAFREIGFTYVTLDVEGYRTGSLNEGLNKQ